MRFLLCASTIWFSLLAPPQSATAQTLPELFGQQSPRSFAYLGVATCTSSGCHGKSGGRGSKGSEYTTWINHDFHAKAYASLFKERSLTIERNLKRLGPNEKPRPEKNALCLRCHVAPGIDLAQRGRRFTLEDGVGCESCHGPAEKWLGPHSKRGWAGLSTERKSQSGMKPTKDFHIRAAMCADCHIGTPDADVNHDLIAAGHPRLRFELGSYHANLPKHWSWTGEKRKQRDLEARLWIIGQLVSAQYSLELLEARAEGEKRPWPEFAEYDCYSCHHDLAEPSWRQARGYGNRKPGSLPWGTWYFSMPNRLSIGGTLGNASLSDNLKQLDELMSHPRPDRQNTVKLAKSSLASIEKMKKAVSASTMSLDQIRQFGRATIETPPEAGLPVWDELSQIYLAQSAIYYAKTDLSRSERNSTVEKALDAYVTALEFPKALNSPKDFDPEKVKARLNELKELIK